MKDRFNVGLDPNESILDRQFVSTSKMKGTAVVVGVARTERERERKNENSILYFFRTELSPSVTSNLDYVVAFDAVAAPETETLFCLQFVQRTRPRFTFLSSPPRRSFP